ncbi:MAG: hypothetical protein JWQ42_765 [Edaphobacter sp.]|nr:hypothetical protein [Edaphobacter sp.]
MTAAPATLQTLTDFLQRLRDAKIHYRLSDPTGAIMVEVTVPGERWEIEFHEDGQIGVEVFKSRGFIEGATAINELFNRFTD